MSSEQIKVSKIEWIPTQSGKDRWILNGDITVWSSTIAEELSKMVGQTIDAEINQTGNFFHIKSYKPINQSPKDITAEYQQLNRDATNWDAKDRRIVRQSCLKSAVELTKETIFYLQTKGTTITFENLKLESLKLAEEFVDWVYK